MAIVKPIAQDGLIGRLPEVRGRYTADASLGGVTWFQAGGRAEVMFKPADLSDLCHFLKHKPADVPCRFLGVGSNVLIRDGGVKGVVIRLGREFAKIEARGDKVHAGGGALDVNVALVAEQAGLSGLEFLSGIPGTIGGALRMNGGAYGGEIKDCLVTAEAVDEKGNARTLSLADMQFNYRKSGTPKEWIFTACILQGKPGEREDIRRKMEEIAAARESTQPVRAKTGGSTFKNPPGRKAWELVDKAGCRGLMIGGAQISEKHCNFMINTGNATGADLENLGEEVRRRVKEATGIDLEWEIERWGEK